MDTEMIRNLLYVKSDSDVAASLSVCTESPVLHVYAYNYNWNNGFKVPQIIVDNPACSLGTALMLFYLADGFRYLTEKDVDSAIPDWLEFVSGLYRRIIAGAFADRSIGFEVPLSKVQIFKLKKQLADYEQVFISSIEGEDYNITL